MDKVLLETRLDKWGKLAVFPELHSHSFAELNVGGHNLELVADTGNVHYHRAVLCRIHGLPVGYLRNHFASYFQPQIIKLGKAGIVPYVPCRIISGRVVLHRYLDRDELIRQTHELVGLEKLIS